MATIKEVEHDEHPADRDPKFTLTVDIYELEIIKRAVRNQQAVDECELDDKMSYLSSLPIDGNVMNDPDIAHDQEILDRGQLLLEELRKVIA